MITTTVTRRCACRYSLAPLCCRPCLEHCASCAGCSAWEPTIHLPPLVRAQQLLAPSRGHLAPGPSRDLTLVSRSISLTPPPLLLQIAVVEPKAPFEPEGALLNARCAPAIAAPRARAAHLSKGRRASTRLATTPISARRDATYAARRTHSLHRPHRFQVMEHRSYAAAVAAVASPPQGASAPLSRPPPLVRVFPGACSLAVFSHPRPPSSRSPLPAAAVTTSAVDDVCE